MLETHNTTDKFQRSMTQEDFPVPPRKQPVSGEDTNPGRLKIGRTRTSELSTSTGAHHGFKLRVPGRPVATNTEAKVSDYCFVSVFRGVHQTGGARALRLVLRQLSSDDLKILKPLLGKETFLGIGKWYSLDLYCRLLHAIDHVMEAAGYPDHLFILGQNMGRAEVKKILGHWEDQRSPGWLFDMTEQLWAHYHNIGRWKIERTPVSIIASLEDHPNTDPAFCTVFMGWIMGAVDPTDQETFDGSHALCRSRGAPRCVYTCRWE